MTAEAHTEAGAAPSGGRWLIYGATGYTGRLAARLAAERGLEPILAARSWEAVDSVARELGLEFRVFGLDDPTILRESLDSVDAVLHCAGPFVRTSRPMVDACLAAGVHYLDITGEIPVFESVLGRAAEAREAGVVLLPGVGFDVVPSDCLAARLHRELPAAESLELAFHSDTGTASGGTLKTMIESLPHAGAVRRDGRIVPVPMAWDAKEIDFSCGRRWAMTIPWGDVSTAFHTTGIPNIRVYRGASPRGIARARRMRPFLPLLGTRPVKRFLQWRIGRTVDGPAEELRRTARMHLWGKAEGGGEAVTGTLDTPEGYSLTAATAVESARRVAAGEVEPGAWTPAKAFGADYVLGFDGVTAGDVERRPVAGDA